MGFWKYFIKTISDMPEEMRFAINTAVKILLITTIYVILGELLHPVIIVITGIPYIIIMIIWAMYQIEKQANRSDY